MYKDDYSENSGPDIFSLIELYEQAMASGRIQFLEEDSLEQIIEFYREKDEPEKALEVVDQALAYNSFSSSFFLQKAELLLDLRKYSEALEAIDKVEILDPCEPDITFIKCDIFIRQNRPAQAIQVIQEQLDKATVEDRESLYLEMAEVYEFWGKDEKVFKALKEALLINPLNEEALTKMCLCVEMNLNFEESIVLHEGLIEAEPYSFLAWYNLGKALMGLSLYEKAIEAFEFVHAIKEDHDLAYFDRAESLFHTGNYKTALKVFKDALTYDCHEEEVYFFMGRCHEELKQFTKARHFYRKSIHFDPYFSESYFRIGNTYRIQHKPLQAKVNFKKALQLEEYNPMYLTALANVYFEEGETEEAIQLYNSATQIFPEEERNWIILAKFQLEAGLKHNALDTLRNALDQCGETPDLLYTFAACLFVCGKKNEAIFALDNALEIDFHGHTILYEFVPELKEDLYIAESIEQYKKLQ